jgi:DNA-binding Lrp family transcriptional regulator
LEIDFTRSTQINGSSSESKFYEKPKRNAFVFITTNSEASKKTLEDLKQIDCVSEVYLSHGVYDIVAKVTGESIEHIREGALRKIKDISNIRSVLTLTII